MNNYINCCTLKNKISTDIIQVPLNSAKLYDMVSLDFVNETISTISFSNQTSMLLIREAFSKQIFCKILSSLLGWTHIKKCKYICVKCKRLYIINIQTDQNQFSLISHISTYLYIILYVTCYRKITPKVDFDIFELMAVLHVSTISPYFYSRINVLT